MFAAKESAWHERGTWKELKDGENKSATFTCPECSVVGILDLNDFSIKEDGTIEPSVDCPTEGCAFHDRVILVDWNPNQVRDYRPLQQRYEAKK